MASQLLSSFGQALAGPLGAALGAMAGAGLDQALRRSARALPSLAVQTSAYGDPLPWVFGTARVAGVVIWATDLRRGGGGKGGRGGTDGWMASFAVALSSRPIAGVGRIWADGRELRNAAGQTLLPFTFRLHRGLEDQEPDPLIVAQEGTDRTPAFRGLAYAVFEDFPVSPWGNRIPHLSFELHGDPEGPWTRWVPELLRPMSLRVGDQVDGLEVRGLVIGEESPREAAALLIEGCHLPFAWHGHEWRLADGLRIWDVPTSEILVGPARADDPRGGELASDPDRRPPGRKWPIWTSTGTIRRACSGTTGRGRVGRWQWRCPQPCPPGRPAPWPSAAWPSPRPGSVG